MKHKPKIGKEFPLDFKEERHFFVERTRARIALVVLAACLSALIGAGGYSMYQRDFSYLSVTWSVVAAPIGWIISHYFRESRAGIYVDDESTA